MVVLFLLARPQANNESHILLFIVLQIPHVVSMGLYEIVMTVNNLIAAMNKYKGLNYLIHTITVAEA